MICLTRSRRTFTISLMITISQLSVILQIMQMLFLLQAALNWIESNQMIANPEKFHLMFISANKKYLISQQAINMGGILLKSEANITLLSVDIDNCLSFHGHISNLCRKAANQINVQKRLSSFMRIK